MTHPVVRLVYADPKAHLKLSIEIWFRSKPGNQPQLAGTNHSQVSTYLFFIPLVCLSWILHLGRQLQARLLPHPISLLINLNPTPRPALPATHSTHRPTRTPNHTPRLLRMLALQHYPFNQTNQSPQSHQAESMSDAVEAEVEGEDQDAGLVPEVVEALEEVVGVAVVVLAVAGRRHVYRRRRKREKAGCQSSR